MTQYFAFRNFRLWRAPRSTRVLLTLFNASMVVATVIGALMYRVRTGITASGAVSWYRGNEGSARPGEEMLFARSFKEMLDVTHPHAFSQPFLFFVLCHLFALTRVSERVKTTVYIVAFSTVFVDLGVPYLIRFVSPAFATLQIANYVAMTLVLAVLLWVPTHEMWWYREPAVDPALVPPGV